MYKFFSEPIKRVAAWILLVALTQSCKSYIPLQWDRPQADGSIEWELREQNLANLEVGCKYRITQVGSPTLVMELKSFDPHYLYGKPVGKKDQLNELELPKHHRVALNDIVEIEELDNPLASFAVRAGFGLAIVTVCLFLGIPLSLDDD